MRLHRGSNIGQVAAVVASALKRAGIRAVLTGGACASLYSRGMYQSFDLDFILRSGVRQQDLDAVMRRIGFRRRGRHYERSDVSFFVEFPSGPLGIGGDLKIVPVALRVGRVSVLVLSPTDSCRDRLAAFYHWGDRQSLETAVAIARRRKVNLEKIRRWSRTEGALTKFLVFRTLLKERNRVAQAGKASNPL